MNRRQFLQVTGFTTAVGLAGCLSSSSDGSSADSSPTGTAEGTGTPQITPAPDGESFSYEGVDEFRSEPMTLEQGVIAIDIQNVDSRNSYFGAGLVAAGGVESANLVNTTGPFDGTASTIVDGGEYEFLITGAGDWNATVRQPRYSEAEYESIPNEFSGSDHSLLGPFDLEEGTMVTASSSEEEGVSYGGEVEAYTLSGVNAGRVVYLNQFDDGNSASGTFDQSAVVLLSVGLRNDWTLKIEAP